MVEKILINSELLEKKYLPKKLNYREKQFDQLYRNIQNNINTILIGPVGSGKTTLLQKIISDMKVLDIRYVNCTVYDTQFSVLKEVIPSSKFVFVRSVYELIKRLRFFGNFLCLE